MDRRTFVKSLVLWSTGVVSLLAAGGCIAPRVSPTVWEQNNGAPWHCQNCGHLTRSNLDLSKSKCPHCGRRMLKPISEEALQECLKNVKAPRKG